MARWVGAYLQEAGVERAVVVGWSLGGGVSVELAAADPARVKALVLVSPAAVPLQLQAGLRLLTLPFAGELMAAIGSSRGLRRFAMRDTYGPGFAPSEAVLDRYFGGWEVEERARYIRTLLRTLTLDDTYERVAQVSAPAWVIHGTRDRLVPPRAGEQLAERLAHAQLELLDGVGHSPHVERPQAVLDAIRAALR
jgi:pimeloyl-ACP methyl ester carboxylesterase